MVALLLKHPSAAELDKNLPANAKVTGMEGEDSQGAADGAADAVDAADAAEAEEDGAKGSAASQPISQSYTHHFRFLPGGPTLAVREVGSSWLGDVFKATASDDTTGMQLWAASLIMARCGVY